MIDLSKYRIIDLSYELVPGERKVNGSYLHGESLYNRSIEVQEFIAYEARMHFIQGQTHIGTHTEAPNKWSDTGEDLGSVPLASYMGEAVACNLTHKKAGDAVTVDDLRQFGIKKGDIVLVWGSAETGGNPPHLAVEATNWLVETGIKMLAIENLLYAPSEIPFGPDHPDARLLVGGVAVVDAVVGLDQIRKPRVFFIALPVKLRRVTAFWTRAIALEEKDA